MMLDAIEFEPGRVWVVDVSWGPPDEARRARKKIIIKAGTAEVAGQLAVEFLTEQGVADVAADEVNVLDQAKLP